jgi:hypothetical protein
MANHFQLAGYAVLRSSNLLLCHSPCVFVNTFQQHFVDAWGDLRSSDLRSSIFSAVLLVSRHSLTHRGCASRKRRSLSFRGPACPWDGPALSGTLSITFPFSLHALRFSFVFALLTPGCGSVCPKPDHIGAVPMDAEGRRVGFQILFAVFSGLHFVARVTSTLQVRAYESPSRTGCLRLLVQHASACCSLRRLRLSTDSRVEQPEFRNASGYQDASASLTVSLYDLQPRTSVSAMTADHLLGKWFTQKGCPAYLFCVSC